MRACACSQRNCQRSCAAGARPGVASAISWPSRYHDSALSMLPDSRQTRASSFESSAASSFRLSAIADSMSGCWYSSAPSHLPSKAYGHGHGALGTRLLLRRGRGLHRLGEVFAGGAIAAEQIEHHAGLQVSLEGGRVRLRRALERGERRIEIAGPETLLPLGDDRVIRGRRRLGTALHGREQPDRYRRRLGREIVCACRGLWREARYLSRRGSHRPHVVGDACRRTWGGTSVLPGYPLRLSRQPARYRPDRQRAACGVIGARHRRGHVRGVRRRPPPTRAVREASDARAVGARRLERQSDEWPAGGRRSGWGTRGPHPVMIGERAGGPFVRRAEPGRGGGWLVHGTCLSEAPSEARKGRRDRAVGPRHWRAAAAARAAWRRGPAPHAGRRRLRGHRRSLRSWVPVTQLRASPPGGAFVGTGGRRHAPTVHAARPLARGVRRVPTRPAFCGVSRRPSGAVDARSWRHRGALPRHGPRARRPTPRTVGARRSSVSRTNGPQAGDARDGVPGAPSRNDRRTRRRTIRPACGAGPRRRMARARHVPV